MVRKATRWALLLRILCAVALLSVGLAHGPVSAAPTLVDLAAYTLPDGTIADICIDDMVDGKEKMHRPAKACEACRIGHAALLPLPSVPDALPAPARMAEARPRAGPVLSARHERPGAIPRAPPALAA